MRFIVIVFTTLLVLLAANIAQAALRDAPGYGATTYSPGEQHGGSYDCPTGNRSWIVNGFYKSQSSRGKAIFIDGNGNWIGAAEDDTDETILARQDLEGVHKKGSVKNTSCCFTYSGFGVPWYEDLNYC